jgi:outer membrane protein OmpA-like peptidoglycan-associated protein
MNLRRRGNGNRLRRNLLSWVVWTSSLAILASIALSVVPGHQSVTGASTTLTSTVHSPHATSPSVPVPDGTASASEPSGQAPPSSTAMTAYTRTYVNDFMGTSLPEGWNVYRGTPGSGDPGSQWAASHVAVSGGLLQLNTWQDPAFGGKWVTGGLCQCGVTHSYGAYFVRSRVTGAGPTQVELLWPTTGWPPEIDFNETNGATDSSMATLHFNSDNAQVHSTINTDMSKWHTWGVIWTATSVSYTLDGSVWAHVNVPGEVPHQPMTLDIQQQTWCGVAPNPLSPSSCPTTPQSTLVDWVAEYGALNTSTTTTSSTTTSSTTTTTTPSGASAITVRPFAANSASLSPELKSQIANLADQITAASASKVVLTGYSDSASSQATSLAISTARAMTVARYLQQLLSVRHVRGVKIAATGKGSAKPVASNATSSGRAKNRRVVVTVH